MPVTAVSTAPSQEPQLTSLITRMAQGDEEALAVLYDATSPSVYGLALRIVRDPSAAEEVVLEVYTQGYRQAVTYDPCRGTPSAWLLTLTRSRALDRRRRDAKHQQHETPLEYAAAIPAATPTPEEWSLMSDMQRAVRGALATLCPEQRQVLEIAYYEGLSHAEIAARLGHPLGTVKTRLRLGMLALRQVLVPSETRPAAHSGRGQVAGLRNSTTSGIQTSPSTAMTIKQS